MTKKRLKRIENKIKTDQISLTPQSGADYSQESWCDWDDWTPSFLVQVAAPIYNAVMKASEVFEEYAVRDSVNGHYNTRKLIGFTKDRFR